MTSFSLLAFVFAFNSGDGSELVKEVPIRKRSEYVMTRLYSVKMPELGFGNVLSTQAYAEITNNHGKYGDWVMIGWATVLEDAYGNWKEEVTEPKATNCLRNQHHCVINDATTHFVSGNYRDSYLSFFVWAGSATHYDKVLTVEQDYGRLSGFLIR